MARKATLIATGALSLALIAACPALATAETPEDPDKILGVAGAMLSANEDAEKELPAALKGETDIEKLTIAHDAAVKGLREAENRVAEIQVQINELEAILPGQQARSDAAIRQRYIMQTNPLAIAEPLLSSQTLEDFIRQIDYLQIISRENLREFNKTRDMKSELDSAKEEQGRLREEAAAAAADALESLEEEQDERAEKQEEGQEKAIRQAATESGESPTSNDDENDSSDEDSDDESSSEKDSDGDSGRDETEVTRETSDLIDGADWHAHRDDFIAEWAGRLDDYLEGTPLEGHGADFAASAWKYCIDPRWSAAISNTESSKGQVCIRPHNAWGWGAADSDPYNLASEWGSWEEAIDAHAAGLAKGYGYTISMRGAQSYCPPSWQSWYNKTLAEMAKI